MPLPKAPTQPADLLEDYGAPAKPAGARRRTPVSAPEAAPAPKNRARRGAAAAAPSVPEPALVQNAAKKRTKAVKAVKTTKPRTSLEAAAQQAPLITVEPAQETAARPEATMTEAATKASEKTTEQVSKETAEKISVKTAPLKSAKKSTKARAKKPASGTPHGLSENLPAEPKTSAAGRRGRAATPNDKPKLFVLDTNVLMHDPLSLFRFAEHDVFLPMTTLEELDNHKKGLTDVARNARTVSRSLDALIEANAGRIDEGVPLSLLGNSEAQGRLWFETKPMAVDLPAALPSFRGDNSILATVKGVDAEFPSHAVVLVSKDINMRIKATTLGIPAEDYFNDKVLDDSDMIYTGKLELEASFWESIAGSLRSWQDNGSTFYAFEASEPHRFILNECVTIEGDEGFMALVADVKGREVTLRLLKDYRKTGRSKVWGIQARNREQNMALNLLMDPDIDFVTLLGQAGTGKTLMTLAAALTQTIDERRFSEIIVTRATVSVGEDIGFLPGTEEEKMAPWMGALEDNLEVLHRTEGAGEWGRQASLDLIRNRIRVKSMSFMRGRTFLQKFVIIDEAQNLSPKQMKTLITRAGPGTKIVCLGNIAQIDTPYLTEGSSGLTYVVERFQGWAHAATITLTRGERSRLAEFASEAL